MTHASIAREKERERERERERQRRKERLYSSTHSSSRDRRYYTRLARREEVGVGSPSAAILSPFNSPATPYPPASVGFPLFSSLSFLLLLSLSLSRSL